MGLDMYAWAVAPENVISDIELKEDAGHEEIFYWRKHHDLHGWMEALYKDRGGEKEFNCAVVRLYEEDLDSLENDVKENVLPKTTGFFFGDNPPDEESIAKDLEFIRRARESIKNGFAVYYTSWW